MKSSKTVGSANMRRGKASMKAKTLRYFTAKPHKRHDRKHKRQIAR